jgi:hypothetical protein
VDGPGPSMFTRCGGCGTCHFEKCPVERILYPAQCGTSYPRRTPILGVCVMVGRAL